MRSEGSGGQSGGQNGTHSMSDPFVEVSNLSCSFQTPEGAVHAVRDLSFSLEKGQRLAVVGESGSGKSVTSLALMGLLNPRSAFLSGTLRFEGVRYAFSDRKSLRPLRGKEIAMVFQDPMNALNPFLTIERQLTEVLELHKNLTHRGAKKRAIEMLERTGIPNPAARIKQYPHQYACGMRQRVMVAMALLCSPKLLIADEPTTALDVTVQAQIISLLKELSEEMGAAVMFITHDLGVVASFAERVMVMYAGRVVERASVHKLFREPAHPYTQGLLRSVPRIDSDASLYAIPGRAAHGGNLPRGCAFAARCPRRQDRCAQEEPDVVDLGEQHLVRCPFVEMP